MKCKKVWFLVCPLGTLRSKCWLCWSGVPHWMCALNGLFWHHHRCIFFFLFLAGLHLEGENSVDDFISQTSVFIVYYWNVFLVCHREVFFVVYYWNVFPLIIRPRPRHHLCIVCVRACMCTCLLGQWSLPWCVWARGLCDFLPWQLTW